MRCLHVIMDAGAVIVANRRPRGMGFYSIRQLPNLRAWWFAIYLEGTEGVRSTLEEDPRWQYPEIVKNLTLPVSLTILIQRSLTVNPTFQLSLQILN